MVDYVELNKPYMLIYPDHKHIITFVSFTKGFFDLYTYEAIDLKNRTKVVGEADLGRIDMWKRKLIPLSPLMKELYE